MKPVGKLKAVSDWLAREPRLRTTRTRVLGVSLPEFEVS